MEINRVLTMDNRLRELFVFVPQSANPRHYNDVIMNAVATQITSLAIVYSYIQGSDQRKHQSSASLAFVGKWPVNSPHKGPVTRKKFPFDDVIVNPRDTYYQA